MIAIANHERQDGRGESERARAKENEVSCVDYSLGISRELRELSAFNFVTARQCWTTRLRLLPIVNISYIIS